LIDYGQETSMKRILLTSLTVKVKITFGNRLGFQAQIGDLGLKFSIFGVNSKNKRRGSYQRIKGCG
jgi:hypothetical protein